MSRTRHLFTVLAMSGALALGACASHTPATTNHPVTETADTRPVPPPPEFQSSKVLHEGSELAASDSTRPIPPQETVLFDVDSHALTPQAQVDLEAAARWLVAHPQRVFVIEGHADPTGTESYNLELSRQRAVAVAKYLVDRGAPLDRIYVDAQGENDAAPKADFGDRRAVIYAARRPDQAVNQEQGSEGQTTAIQEMQKADQP
jgi:outer membrane protein OmpA-like peptidoglycan-associated protein